jgi:hypothetical protein
LQLIARKFLLEQRCGLTEAYGGGFKMNNEFNSRNLHRRLDLAGTLERIQKRERVAKEQAQTPQQISADAREAYERGFRSAFSEANRKIHLQRLAQADPAMAFWLTANRDPRSA